MISQPSTIYQVIKTLLVLAILLGFVNGIHAFSLPTDTLIIDGKTVSVEVKQGEEETQPEDEIPYDSLASNLFRTKLIGLGYARGFSFNNPVSTGSVPALDEFIGNTVKGGNFENLELSFLAETQKNVWIGASLGIANWDIRHTSYMGDFGSKFFSFENLESNSLNQIDTTLTDIGAEFDTLQVELGIENHFTSNLSLGLQLGTELFKKKANEKTRFIGLVGMNLLKIRNYTVDDFHFLNEKNWFKVNTEELDKNKFELSGSLKFILLHQVSDKIILSSTVLFTERFSSAFIDGSAINYSRRGVGLGISISWKL